MPIIKQCQKCGIIYKVKPFRKDSKFCSRNCLRGHKLSEETIKKMRETAIRNGNKPPSSKGKKWNYQQRKRHSERIKGEKSHFWKGGVTEKNRSKRAVIMNSIEYKLWRRAVFSRDNFTCIWCGIKGNTKKNEKGRWISIQADHIKSFSQFPELRFAIDNGRTLCEPCHRTTDNYGMRGKVINNHVVQKHKLVV